MRYYRIYRLVDPRYSMEDPRYIRYIGRTSSKLSARLSQHLTSWCKDGGPKWKWLQEMLQAEVKPDIVAIEKVNSSREAKEREQHWIHHYESLGYQLVNIQQMSHRNRAWDRQRVKEDFRTEVMRLLLGQDSPYCIAMKNFQKGEEESALQLYLQSAETPVLSIEEIPALFRECDERVRGLKHRVMRAITSGEILESIASALKEAIEESEQPVAEEASAFEHYVAIALTSTPQELQDIAGESRSTQGRSQEERMEGCRI